MKRCNALCAATVVAILGIVFIAQAQRPESSDDRAVREALDKWRSALNNEDLATLLATLSDDAVIDSSAAGRKVDKKDYKEVMKFVMDGHYTGKFTIKDPKVTLPDSTHATAEGTLDRNGVARKHRWNLEKRTGKWLIVGTEYLK
jgi:ketosteroid isomerase-like protein